MHMDDDAYYDFWRKHWIHAVFVLAFLIAGLGVWLHCNRIATNPQRVFWGMVSQSLATASVTVTSSQMNDKNSIKQTLAYALGSTNTARSRVEIKQPAAEVITEVIGTPKADYTRYIKAKPSYQAVANKLDQSKLINVWAKSDPQLFGQALLGLGLSLGSVPVPIGQVTGEQRTALLKEIRERALYQTDFDKVGKFHKDGRLYYTYDIETTPFVYVQIMKMFAKDIGIRSLENIDALEYRDLAKIKMRLTVDVRAHRLTKAVYAKNNFTQDYGAYDVPVEAVLPAQTISLDELRKRFAGISEQ
jgi:hypothetical protein